MTCRTISRILMLACTLSATSAGAHENADSCAARPRIGRTVERMWLWGAGKANVLDTYLSPLEYTGPELSLLHRAERKARWGKGRVTAFGIYTGHAAYLASPTDDGKEWDAEITAAGGWLYNWRPGSRWRIAAGGSAELSTGFTYNTRGSNNPAQGRLGLSIAASALAEYTFPLFGGTAAARIQADAPLAGVQFAPEYGQSYYEIFSLGHHSGVVHFTHPANAPTARLLATLEMKVAGGRLVTGYLADVRQSRLSDLKRHAWRNCFMIGYVRTLAIVRRH